MSNRRSKSRTSFAGKPRRRSTIASSGTVDSSGRPRLQKVLAAAGLGSRRDCEDLILEGRVEIDRRAVTQLGTRVDPTVQEIRVDGEALSRAKRQYFMLNKPIGVVSTARDPAGRPRVTDLIKTDQRLFPVGRLDLSSEGLILVTNDGDFANLLAHPRYEIEKTYLAEVAGVPTREAIARLERGVHLAEGYAHAKRIRIKTQHKHSATLEVVLDEGRNREVRRLLARIGHKVLRLKRIAIGGLRLGNLAVGEYRPLRPEEIRGLKDAAIAALNRDRKAPTTGGREPPAGPATVRPSRPDQTLDQPVDEPDVTSPRRRGTLIGADEDAALQTRRNTIPPGLPSAETVRPSGITPLIDVRRGIFPGASIDDFDEDEPIKPPPRPSGKPPRRPAGKPPRKTPKHNTRGRRSGKPSVASGRANQPAKERRAKKQLRRKGRRR